MKPIVLFLCVIFSYATYSQVFSLKDSLSLFTGQTEKPLLIIDDSFVGNFNNVFDSSIASIKVYKGVDAVLEFGSKGKNGVISVLTKNFVIKANEIDSVVFCDKFVQKIKYKDSTKRSLYQNMRYPEKAIEKNIQGVVTIKFKVSVSGVLSDFSVYEFSKCKDKDLVAESIRLLKR